MLVSLAALLPAVVSGFAGGALAGRILSPMLPDGQPSELEERSSGWVVWLSAGIVLLAMLGLVSSLTFVGRPAKVDPPPPPPPVEVVPLPPPFRYVKPTSFDFAQPGQFSVAARKSIPTAATRIHSPNPA